MSVKWRRLGAWRTAAEQTSSRCRVPQRLESDRSSIERSTEYGVKAPVDAGAPARERREDQRPVRSGVADAEVATGINACALAVDAEPVAPSLRSSRWRRSSRWHRSPRWRRMARRWTELLLGANTIIQHAAVLVGGRGHDPWYPRLQELILAARPPGVAARARGARGTGCAGWAGWAGWAGRGGGVVAQGWRDETRGAGPCWSLSARPAGRRAIRRRSSNRRGPAANGSR